MKKISRPEENEYSPSAKRYIDLVPLDGKVLQHLASSIEAVKQLVHAIPQEKLTYRWAEEEWTVKEILVHIMDTERILAYRALRFARNDPTGLAPYDQESFVAASGANDRKLGEILNEYTAIRNATLTLFFSLHKDALTRAGIVNGKRVSVRGLAYTFYGRKIFNDEWQHHAPRPAEAASATASVVSDTAGNIGSSHTPRK